MNSLLKFGLILILFVQWGEALNASHIIGGEINYRCLGNDQYEITFILFRDCFYGQVPFDDPASIGFFGSDNELVTEVGDHGQILISPQDIMDVPPTLDNPCIQLPEDLCVQVGTYRDTVELPFREGGYLLVYQSCCRNRSISNLRLPGATGASFITEIEEKALLECNNSAVFNEWPSTLICVNQPIEFDHSATDADGDSLVYSLCTPLTGGSFQDPQPQPPEPPPYPSVQWETPQFSFDNKLGGDDPLTIDPHTGLLTGTPMITGQFIVGVCVEEYRDGELISRTSRDFQYNVGNCDRCIADFFVAENYCDQLEIEFENLTSVCEDELIWYFGNFDSPLDSSVVKNPTFTFPDYGTYEITLIAFDEDSICNDTITKTINLLEIPFDIDIGVERGECNDQLEIEFQSLVDSDTDTVFNYFWTINWGSEQLNSTDSTVQISVSDVETVHARLTVTHPEFKCFKTVELIYDTGLILEDGLFREDFVCYGDTIELLPFARPDRDYQWEPAESIIGSADIPNPIVSPDTTTLYTAVLTNQNCTGEISVQVGSYNPDFQQVIPDTVCGTLTVDFDYNPFVGFATSSWWRFLQDGETVHFVRTDYPSVTFPDYGEYQVILNARNFDFPSCPDTFIQNIYLMEWDFDLDLHVEKGRCADSLEIYAEAFVSEEIPGSYSLEWMVNGESLDLDSSRVTFFYTGSDSIHIGVFLRNDFGCIKSADTLIFSGLPEGLGGHDQVVVCLGDSLMPDVPFFPEFDYQWNTNLYFVDTASVFDPVIFPESDITYELIISDSLCSASYILEVEVVELPTLDLPDLGICEGDSIVIEFPDGLPDNIEIFQIIHAGMDTVQILHEQGEWVFLESGVYEIETVLFHPLSSCEKRFFNTLEVSVPPDVNLGIEVEEEWCINDSIFLQLVAQVDSNDLDFDLIWNVSGDTVFTHGGTFLELFLSGVEELEISLILTNAFGCTQSVDIDFSFDLLEYLPNDTLTICQGDTVYLNPGYQEDWSYVWSPGDFLLSGLTAPNPAAAPGQSTLFQAELSNNSCTGTQWVYVEVLDTPAVHWIAANPMQITPGESSYLSIEFVPDTVDLIWSPPESLSDPFSHQPVAEPEETTTYTVSLISENGCSTQAQVTVFVEDIPCDEPFVYLPNAFSPNGDGMNDVLYVRGEQIQQMLLIVYNRLGQEVFRSNDPARGWDGRFQNEDLPPDVYGYHLEVSCFDGGRYVSNGSVTLIR